MLDKLLELIVNNKARCLQALELHCISNRHLCTTLLVA